MSDLQSAHSSRQASPQTVMWLVFGLLALSLALYATLGHPGILLGQQNPSQAKDEPDVERMVANLAKKLESEPGNLKGWVMLARSYKVMGRNLEAAQAFERAGNFIDKDAQLLAIYADLIVTNAGGSFAGKPMLLIEKALKLEPDNVMALWLAGSAAYQVKNYQTAVRYWERISRQLVADTDDARTLQESINEAYAKLGQSAPLSQAKPLTKTVSSTAMSVKGVVELDASLKTRASPEDVVMVIARPLDSRMPVAVLRKRAADLPLTFTLDDSLAMSPQARLSMNKEINIEARISKSGMAQPESGDLFTSVQTVKVGASNLRLKVNQVRP